MGDGEITAELAGRYEVLRTVGQGAHGTVYEARDRTLDRQVALKVLRVGEDFDALRARLVREARLLAAHPFPGIVGILDLDLDADEPYLALEWMPGGDLLEVLAARERVPVGELARMGARLAHALDHLHARDVLHRDIKLENILRDARGEVALADLGLARPITEVALTRTGCVVGTPRYMAPEVLDSGAYSGASDVFALGAALLELAAGERVEGVAAAGAAVEPLLARVGSPGLRGVLASCLRDAPGARPSGAVLAAELEALAEGRGSRPTEIVGSPLVSGAFPPEAPREASGGRGPPRVLVGIFLAALLVVGFLSGPDPSPPPRGSAAPIVSPEDPSPRAGAAAAEAADALDRAHRELSPCFVGVGDWAREDTEELLPALEARVDELLGVRCLRPWERYVAALERWLPLAEAEFATRGWTRVPAGLLWVLPAEHAARFPAGLGWILNLLQQRLLRDPRVAGLLADLRPRILERTAELSAVLAPLADRIEEDPAENSLLELFLRQGLLGELEFPGARSVAVAQEFERRVHGEGPLPYPDAMVRAYLAGVAFSGGEGDLDAVRLDCDTYGPLVRSLGRPLPLRGVSTISRLEVLVARGREAIRYQMACGPPGDAAALEEVRRWLDRWVAVWMVLEHHQGLLALRELIRRWDLSGASADAAYLVGVLEEAARPVAGGRFLGVTMPVAPLAPEKREELERELVAIRAALAAERATLAGCAARYDHETRPADPAGYAPAVEGLLAPGCMEALARTRDAAGRWVEFLRAHHGQGWVGAAELLEVDGELRAGMLLYLRRLEQLRGRIELVGLATGQHLAWCRAWVVRIQETQVAEEGLWEDLLGREARILPAAEALLYEDLHEVHVARGPGTVRLLRSLLVGAATLEASPWRTELVRRALQLFATEWTARDLRERGCGWMRVAVTGLARLVEEDEVPAASEQLVSAEVVVAALESRARCGEDPGWSALVERHHARVLAGPDRAVRDILAAQLKREHDRTSPGEPRREAVEAMIARLRGP